MNGSMRSHDNGVAIDFVQHLLKVSEIQRIAVGHRGEALKKYACVLQGSIVAEVSENYAARDIDVYSLANELIGKSGCRRRCLRSPHGHLMPFCHHPKGGIVHNKALRVH
jgi:hypothetical protein